MYNRIPKANMLTRYLYTDGRTNQQDRMIRDKRKTLSRALLYSYQGAQVKKLYDENDTIERRALINPNKIKQDYDEKIISIGFESNFKTGDVFQWLGTNTYWLIYLQNDPNNTCWRIEATDLYSTPGIIEINAVEYYSNEIEDDIEAGLVGALKVEPIDPSPVSSKAVVFITGDTFIKPKKEYIYSIGGKIRGTWAVTKDRPVTLEPFTDEKGFPSVKVKWNSTYSGQFELSYGNYNKTIVVESLF